MKDYKYNFILLKGTKQESYILLDAITKHIEKLVKDIESYSKSEHYIRGNDIEGIAKQINLLMYWRDNLEYLGSDTVYSASDFKYPIEKII